MIEDLMPCVCTGFLVDLEPEIIVRYLEGATASAAVVLAVLEATEVLVEIRVRLY